MTFYTMNSRIKYVLLGMVLSQSVFSNIDGINVKKMIPLFEEWVKNPVILAATRLHNSQNLSMEYILETDRVWGKSKDTLFLKKQLMTNSAAKQLYLFESFDPSFFEFTVLGNQGAIVGMTNAISEYWQGGKTNFLQAFNHGKGEIYIEKAHYNKSMFTKRVQVAVPIRDKQEVIGVMVIGMNHS